MARLFVGNFDFEHELAGVQRSTAAALSDRQVPLWIPVAAADDLVLTTSPFAPEDFPDLLALDWPLPRFVTPAELPSPPPHCELVPWGSSAAMSQLAAAHQLEHRGPNPAIVRQVNSRLFRLALEEEWGCGLAGARAISSLEQLAAVVSACARDARWVLKSEFGMSGRERHLGHGPVLPVPAMNWSRRRLAGSTGIVFEPWVERVAEAGIQIEITREGSPELRGVTSLIADRTGTYRGSGFEYESRVPAEWAAAVEWGLRAAGRLAELGYFGPLGFDAMRYLDSVGQSRLRPLQDLNARHTMGRLSLGWRRLLQPGESAAWLHLPASQAAGRSWTETLQALKKRHSPVRLISTSPVSLFDQRDFRPSLLVIAPDAAQRDAAVTSLCPLQNAPHAMQTDARLAKQPGVIRPAGSGRHRQR